MRKLFESRFKSALIWGFVAVAFTAPVAWAENVMTVIATGGNAPVEYSYTLDDLDAMAQVEIVTSNEFSDGAMTYSGPLARDVIPALDEGQFTTVLVSAINDYQIEIPLSDFIEYDVVLSTRVNGKRLSRRDKGPIWIMYPIDAHPELRNALINSRLIWQAVKMELQP